MIITERGKPLSTLKGNVMKASEIIKHALKFYVREEDENNSNLCVYMCHAIEFNAASIGADFNDMVNARAHVYEFLDKYSCGIIHVALCRSDRRYLSYSRRYGFHSNACYSRRVKWFNELVKTLENEGL